MSKKAQATAAKTPASSESNASQDRLELKYVPLSQAHRWDSNPKKHDLDRLIQSIETHGFGDPPKLDATLGCLTYGNGRVESLERMKAAGHPPPRGIGLLEDGEWAVPVIFGVDAESKAAAVAFAIDHNNLTLLGGDLGFTDLLQIWDEEGLQSVLLEAPDASDFLTSLDSQDLDALLTGPDFEPASADEQSRLDRKKEVTCPECGHEFRP
jgi:aryl-alcohol dehydrogenase-like predicted oxidoreductase